jgi:energy-coupling factor transporter transmembrane protein EcfT
MIDVIYIIINIILAVIVISVVIVIVFSNRLDNRTKLIFVGISVALFAVLIFLFTYFIRKGVISSIVSRKQSMKGSPELKQVEQPKPEVTKEGSGASVSKAEPEEEKSEVGSEAGSEYDEIISSDDESYEESDVDSDDESGE